MAVFHLSLAATRTADIWHSIRSSPGPVFWFHSGKRYSQLLCVHLAICQHPLRKQQWWQHTQCTTGITGNQITANVLWFLSEETLCPPTLSLFQDRRGGCKASSLTHQEVEGENKAWWLIQEVKYSKWQTEHGGRVAVFLLCMLISVCGWKNKHWNQQLSISKYRGER